LFGLPSPFAVIVEDNEGNPWAGNTVAVYFLGEESLTTTGFDDFTRLFADPLEASTIYWLIVADDAPEESSFNWYDNGAGAFPGGLPSVSCPYGACRRAAAKRESAGSIPSDRLAWSVRASVAVFSIGMEA
jgi:hypothetical protein